MSHSKAVTQVENRLGALHSFLLRNTKRWMDDQLKTLESPKLRLFDIRTQVESDICKLMKEESVFKCMAFPVGVNCGDVAAHYSPRDLDGGYMDLTKDSVSIDFGLFHPSLGILTDGAFTWNGPENTTGAKLTKIAEEAVDLVIKHSKVDTILGELGGICQEFVESHEIVEEGVETAKPVVSLRDLCGHKIAAFMIHAGKAVPSISLPDYRARMLDGERYAIEVFPTTGSGLSVEDRDEIPTHLSLQPGNLMEQIRHAGSRLAPRVLNIATSRRNVPFHPDWYLLGDDIIMEGVKKGVWTSYPTIRTRDRAPVAQWEKMIRIGETGPTCVVSL